MQSLNYSLSLSLAARGEFINKFHKTSKIKNRESIDGELKKSRGGRVGFYDTCILQFNFHSARTQQI